MNSTNGVLLGQVKQMHRFNASSSCIPYRDSESLLKERSWEMKIFLVKIFLLKIPEFISRKHLEHDIVNKQIL